MLAESLLGEMMRDLCLIC